ncbi:MAG: FG-GAP-like repeat-containing protein [Ignavibacteria bacterium]|nr:FG-GAP-like repeat-containing protein [Ignavibacteria bacterium]
MKRTGLLKCITILFVFSFTSVSNANLQKSQTSTAEHTVFTQKSPVSNSDSLPKGVTRDWLNSLTDENGNRIINEEDPEGDALQQNTFDGDLIGVNYGKSVSNAGDVNGDGFDDVIIGDPNGNGGAGTNSGRAYIYYGGTVINSTADVILTGGAANNYFGKSVSNAGDVNSDGYDDVIVGAYGYNSFTGRAYIYYGGASMNNVADAVMTGAFTSNEFGSSVSGAGDVNGDGYSDVIVGAYATSVYTGKAYIYFGGSSMDNIADVTMTGENSNDNFGYSVSGAGDVNGDGYHDVICGAYGFNGMGRAYVYFGGVSMNNVADVSMYGGAISDFFGASVSNAGDVNDDGYPDVIVGAHGYSSATGRAYIYYGGSVMDGAADVTMTGESSNNSFGYSVSDAGDVNGDGFADVYVGAYGYSSSKGRAYLYYGGASMNNAVDIYMTGEESLNYFGYSISGGGDVNGDGFADMISGAYGYDSNTGRAYVYTNMMTGEDIPDLTMTGEAALNYFGRSVSNAGDLNNDGFDDVIIGASYAPSSTRKAYIFYGGEIMNSEADVTLSGTTPNAWFGSSVSSAGDVNGDGYDDAIVGEPGLSRAYIFYGGVSMNNVADVILNGEVTGDSFGGSVSSAGEVNGDGFDDVIVGDVGFGLGKGRAYIFYGGTSMNNIADVTMTGEAIEDYFGEPVSTAGDVNGDGYSDVIVGAAGYMQGIGRAYIYFGGASMNNITDVTITIGVTGDIPVVSASSAGDVNGDGYSDVIIGDFQYSAGTGRASIYLGGAAMNNIADVTMIGEETSNEFGYSVSGAGDVNNDGYDDVIVGARHYGANNKGRGYIFFGNSILDNIVDIKMEGDNSGYSAFGYSVSTAGDVNGDSYSDVVVGAIGSDNNRGKTYIYLSSPPNNRKNLFLFGAIQGFYDPVLDTEIPDTTKVYLRNSTSPFARVDSSKNILLGPGTGQQFLFRNVQNGIPYYVEVTHRSALSTWSATPVTFVNSDASIAFSVDAIYAYGNNEIQVDASPYNVFAFYSGDVNQDGTIDATDISMIDNDAANFTGGYVVTDLTGDDFVDGTDFVIADNNAANFVSVIRP